ncbi:MAG: hypothetical protein JXA83_14195 [Acidimicrobiales bacterium]|nr:hypothetical protein [Acidimicrobiales bacterium]
MTGPAGGNGDRADDRNEGPRRSRAQIFVPAPEDLPPPETVFGAPAHRRPAGPGGPSRVPGADRPGGRVPPGGATGAAGIPDPPRRPRRPGGAGPPPDPVGAHDVDAGGPSTVPAPFDGPLRDPEPLPGRGGPAGPYGVPEPGPMAAPDLAGGVPDAPVLTPGTGDPLAEPDMFDEPEVFAQPDLPPPGPARPARARRAPVDEPRPRRPPIDRHRLRTVYDVDGPRVRLGVAWFVGALLATVVPLPGIAAIVFAVAAGWAARQIVQAWGSVAWQADVAAGLGAVPVLAALVGTPAVVGAVVVGLVVAVGCALAPDGALLPGGEGRIATVAILVFSMVPALGGAMFVLVWRESAVAAAMLLLVASAYEMGDYIVGSGASNPVEGPLAGITTASLVALPLAIVLVEPYAAGGVALLAFTAVACPLGQILGSVALPGAGAHAPALRRIDTLLVLGPVWAAAAGAF